jgi:serine/threonine-protein kinase
MMGLPEKNDATVDFPAAEVEEPVRAFPAATRDETFAPEIRAEAETAPGTIDYAPDRPGHPGPDAAPPGLGATLDAPPADAGGDPDRSAAAPAAGGEAPVAIRGYEVLGVLGRGGMGVVYQARQIRLNRLVALKMVIAGAHAGPTQLARFLTEAEAVAQLQHPNIVQIYEIGEHDGLPYFSLEFVNGGTLAAKIAGKPLPPRRAAELAAALAAAMDSAHRRGVIHRDLKPANILLTGDGVPKITDFGLAKCLESDSSQTKQGTLLGTPSYMAPEQARGETKECGPLADVYALGATLYEMLTGRPPFVGASIIDTIKQVQTQEPVPPRHLVPKVPVDLETVCLKCLEKEPHKRYAGADALAADLQRFLAGKPIEARPVGPAERFYRWCRRNPQVAALSIGVFTLLVIIAVTSTVLLIRIAQEKRQTEFERQAATQARDLARQNETQAKEAQQNAERAEQVARQNAILAEEQGRLAVNTLYQVVTKVQQQLRVQPRNQKLRIDLLNDAFAGLTKVVAGAENSALVSRTKAAAHQLMGDISKELGRTEAAVRDYQAAQQIVDALAAADPGNDVAVWNQAVVYDRLGDIYYQLLGDGAVARDYYRRCIGLRADLAKRTPKAPELKPDLIRQRLAIAYAKQGKLSLRLGDPVESWSDYQKYLELNSGDKKYPTLKVALEALGNSQNRESSISAEIALRLGEVAFHLGDPENCRGWYTKALEISLAGMKKTPNSDDAKQDVAASYAALGDLELQLGDAGKANDHYARAHELFKEVRADNPDSADQQRGLSLSHYRLGTAHDRLGDSAAAKKDFQAALQLRQELIKLEPHNAYNQIDLALILARCGQHVQAAEQAEKLRARAPKDPGLLFFTGSTYALCSAAVANGPSKDPSLQARYTSSALEALAQAVSHGYRDRAALEHDPDLDAIRKEKRFRELVDTLPPPGEVGTP